VLTVAAAETLTVAMVTVCCHSATMTSLSVMLSNCIVEDVGPYIYGIRELNCSGIDVSLCLPTVL